MLFMPLPFHEVIHPYKNRSLDATKRKSSEFVRGGAYFISNKACGDKARVVAMNGTNGWRIRGVNAIALDNHVWEELLALLSDRKRFVPWRP